MHKVELMTQTPTTCLHCGRGNTPNDPDTMDDFWAIDLERDVNWGDSTYLCMYCVEQMAAIGGYVNEGELAEMTDNVERLRKELHEKDAEFDSYRRRARTLLAGKQAEKSLRADAAQAEKAEAKAKAKKPKAQKKKAA